MGKYTNEKKKTALATSESPKEHRDSLEYSRQGQLGQITEMIHVASLIHDDVLDEAEVRRGGMAVHKLYSNKVNTWDDVVAVAGTVRTDKGIQKS